MGANNSKVMIPAEKSAGKKVQPYRFWPLRYKIEDISVHIAKQESHDDGKNLLGTDISNEESSSMTCSSSLDNPQEVVSKDNIDDHANSNETILDDDKKGNQSNNDAGGNNGDPSSSSVETPTKDEIDDHSMVGSQTLNDNKGKQSNAAVAGGSVDDHQENRNTSVGNYGGMIENSPSFKIYVRDSNEVKNSGPRKVDGDNSDTYHEFHPCMRSDVAGKPTGSNPDKGTYTESEKSNGQQNGGRKGRRLLNAAWSPRDRLASLKRCILAVTMCHSLQNFSSFGRDQRQNLDKKEAAAV